MAPKRGFPLNRPTLPLGIIILIFVLTGCIPAEVATPVTSPTPKVKLHNPSPIPSITPITEPTLLIQPTFQPTPTVTESAIPSSVMITTISGHEQTYQLGCEASAAVDWARYFGVLIYESTFQFDLPLSDNPEQGFVGNVTTDGWGQIPPDAYGVHAPPIAELLREYDLPAQAVRGDRKSVV